MTEAMPLQVDVPCARCGYDLRGLTPPGKCPECGYDFDDSIRAARATGVCPPPQKRWVGTMVEAVVVGLSPFVASIIANALYGTLFEDGEVKQRDTRYIATISALIWSLSGWAAWRLATLEPLERHARGRRLIGMLLRASAVAFLTIACWVWIWGRSFNDDLSRISLFLAGSLAAATFYLRVRHVAIRVGMSGLGGQSLVVAILLPSVMIAMAGSPLQEGLFSITPAVGWSYIASALEAVVKGDEWEDLLRLFAWPLLFTMCQVAVLIQLLIVLLRTRCRTG